MVTIDKWAQNRHLLFKVFVLCFVSFVYLTIYLCLFIERHLFYDVTAVEMILKDFKFKHTVYICWRGPPSVIENQHPLTQ